MKAELNKRKKSEDSNGKKKTESVETDTLETTSGNVTPRPARKPLFEYPALHKLESTLYFCIMIGVFVFAWYRVFRASRDYGWQRGYWNWRFVDLPVLGKVRRDTTNYEWNAFQPLSHQLVPALALHSLLFNLSYALFGKRNEFIWKLFNFVYSLSACCYIFSSRCVLVSAGHGCFIYTVAKLAILLKKNLPQGLLDWLPLRLLVWSAAGPLLYINLEYPGIFITDTRIDLFLPLIFTGYKILGYIGFGLELYSGKKVPHNRGVVDELWRMFHFAFYLPYSLSLIVLYPDFEVQMEERKTKIRDWKEIAKFGLRIAFWYLFIEVFVLNFLYFDAILTDIPKLYAVDQPTLLALGYATGQFFHLKYVVIFGIPSFFAMLDAMGPLPGPICISRVVLYSKMWRSFDRGLYKFFKEYIFIPICEPHFGLFRKIFGVMISYGFVILWHGFSRQYIVWIVFNVIELFMEQGSKALYTIKSVRTFREKHLSDTTFRRILAWLQVCPLAFALYSTFYFLTGATAGYVFVERIFWGETVTLHYPFFLLITIGYFYCNCGMDAERYLALKEKEKEKKLKKN